MPRSDESLKVFSSESSTCTSLCFSFAFHERNEGRKPLKKGHWRGAKDKVVKKLNALLLWISGSLVLVSAAQAFQPDGLPLTPRDQKFFELVEKIDLARAHKQDGPGGLSIDLFYQTKVDGQPVIGNFLSKNRFDNKGDNGTGNPEGHIVSYNLARVLGVSDIYSTGTWYRIDGSVVEALHQIATQARVRGRVQSQNRERVKANTEPLSGQYPVIEGSLSVYLEKKLSVYSLEGSALENARSGPNGLANENNPLLKMMMGLRAQPSEDETFSVRTDKGTVAIDAPQALQDLSAIFVIDAILEQGDRFSGGNIDLLRMPNGRYRLAALDNGAAAIRGYFPSYPGRYLPWLKRMDRNMILRIKEMDRFLQNGGEYLGFTDQKAFLKTLGLRTFTSQFIRNVHSVAQAL